MCECAIRAFATFTELDSVSLVWAAGMTTAEASFSGFRLLAKGAIGPGQATPKAWVTQTVPNAKTAPINGLTPGTTYAIQVRAYGSLGHTEWSDSATRVRIRRASRQIRASL